MGSKIYVGGLPYSTTEQQLSDLFAVHGAVTSARIITDKFTGQSRGSVLSKCLEILRRRRQSTH